MCHQSRLFTLVINNFCFTQSNISTPTKDRCSLTQNRCCGCLASILPAAGGSTADAPADAAVATPASWQAATGPAAPASAERAGPVAVTAVPAAPAAAAAAAACWWPWGAGTSARSCRAAAGRSSRAREGRWAAGAPDAGGRPPGDREAGEEEKEQEEEAISSLFFPLPNVPLLSRWGKVSVGVPPAVCSARPQQQGDSKRLQIWVFGDDLLKSRDYHNLSRLRHAVGAYLLCNITHQSQMSSSLSLAFRRRKKRSHVSSSPASPRSDCPASA